MRRAWLIAAAGTTCMFILPGMMQQSGIVNPDLLDQPVYHEEILQGLIPVPVSGPESEIPQELLDELNRKGDEDNETLQINSEML